ncbi:ABC transporter permease, partial [Pseudomonas syringae pv. actinidiae ICMP 19079]
MPPALMLACMALAAMTVGALWIGLSGLMRQRRGVNETISSLLLSYIALALFRQLVEGPLRDPASLNKPSTPPLD